MSNLGPQFLFHGTVHDLEGDTLTPGTRWGATTPGQDPHKGWGQSRHDYVSATDSEDKAWNFAYSAAGQQVGDVKPRVRVHVVEPNEQTQIGVEHIDHPVLQRAFAEDWYSKPQPAGEHVAPSFKVRETLNIKPGHQGTFPEVNWNQFGKPGTDNNHPGNPRSESLVRQRRLGQELADAEAAKISDGQRSLF